MKNKFQIILLVIISSIFSVLLSCGQRENLQDGWKSSYDDIQPVVSDRTEDSENVPIGSDFNVWAVFSEKMDSSTISSSTVKLTDSSGADIPILVNYDDASYAVSVSLSGVTLARNQTYYFTVLPELTDLFGNKLQAGFTAELLTASGPVISNWFELCTSDNKTDETGILNDGDIIVLYFNENVKIGSTISDKDELALAEHIHFAEDPSQAAVTFSLKGDGFVQNKASIKFTISISAGTAYTKAKIIVNYPNGEFISATDSTGSAISNVTLTKTVDVQ